MAGKAFGGKGKGGGKGGGKGKPSKGTPADRRLKANRGK